MEVNIDEIQLGTRQCPTVLQGYSHRTDVGLYKLSLIMLNTLQNEKEIEISFTDLNCMYILNILLFVNLLI